MNLEQHSVRPIPITEIRAFSRDLRIPCRFYRCYNEISINVFTKQNTYYKISILREIVSWKKQKYGIYNFI